MTDGYEIQGLAFFCKVPADLLGKVSHGAIATWCALDDLADRHTGKCWPSHAYLAEKIGVKDRVICDYLKELEDFGRLERIRRPGTSTVYRLIFTQLQVPHGDAVPRAGAVGTARTCGTPPHAGADELEPVNQNLEQEPKKKGSKKKSPKFTPEIPDDLQTHTAVIQEWIDTRKSVSPHINLREAGSLY